MTDKQCHIAILLLKGAYIVGMSHYGYRVYTGIADPQLKFSQDTFISLKKYLRKDKLDRWVIDKRIVRSLHGRSWINREYKRLLKQKNTDHARS